MIVAVRASIIIAAVLAIFGIVQTPPVTNVLLLIIAAGVIPVLGIAVPADVALVLAAISLMAITAFLYQQYMAYRRELEAWLSIYARDTTREEVQFDVSVPNLREALWAGQSALRRALEASMGVYSWLRSLGRPATAQAIAVREEPSTTLMRVNRWTASMDPDLRERLEILNDLLRHWLKLLSKTWGVQRSKIQLAIDRLLGNKTWHL